MKRILIIEDNELTMDIYKLIFEKYMPDVQVECITNAEEGLERVTKNGFDLLIADYNLKHKEINGMDIARLAYPLGKPILIVSGHKITPKFSLVFRYWDMFSRVSFFGKPFRGKDLIGKVEKQLNIETIPLNEMFHKIINH